MEDREAFNRVSWVNVLGNAVKIIVEGGIGIWFGSLALVGDAIHSVGDLLASSVVLVVGGWAYEDGDEDHPHGHHRFEPFASLFVSLVLVVLSAKLLHDGATGVLGTPNVTYDPLLFGGLVFSILLMLGTYWYTTRVNQTVESASLEALAVDCLNDVYASIAAAVGIVGVGLGFPMMDPIAGLLMGGIVLWQALVLARRNISYLVGEAPGEEKMEEIRETVLDHEDVVGIHDLKVHYVGTVLEVEFHAEVVGDMNLRDAHRMESELIERVQELDEVGDVHIHLDPSGIGEWVDADDDEDS